jgi:hypothetical protein
LVPLGKLHLRLLLLLKIWSLPKMAAHEIYQSPLLHCQAGQQTVGEAKGLTAWPRRECAPHL